MTALESILDRLDITAQQTPGAFDEELPWWQVMAAFERQSFFRLLAGADAEGSATALALHVALGIKGEETILDGLIDGLEDRTDLSWSVRESDEGWFLYAGLDDSADVEATLESALAYARELGGLLEETKTRQQWEEALGLETREAAPPKGGAFEVIGSDDSSADRGPDRDRPKDSRESRGGAVSASEARIAASALTQIGDGIRCAIGFEQKLRSEALNALEEGLELALYTKFQATLESVISDDRAELRLPDDVGSILYVDVFPPKSESPSGLIGNLEAYLDRLEKFSGFGIDLLTYLGVSDTVLEGQRRSSPTSKRRSRRRREPAMASAEESRSAEAAGEEEGFVLGLGGSEAELGHGPLKTGQFTDPRLDREDATTNLVDLVLRHPGYADGRIAQVLNILFSIEYHEAKTLAGRAPCVLAWGIGQKRARSFKNVIESAGGKAILVEPGTFPES